MYYKIIIDETARNRPADDIENDRMFNRDVITVKTLEEVKTKLIERYGKLPNRKRKIYVDDDNGNAKEVGFLYSFWNKDWSHNSKSWFQTDWITIKECKEKVVLLS